MLSFTFDFEILTLIAAVTAACVFLRSLVIVLYRWKFHPLSQFPGPWIAKTTDAYAAYHNAMGNSHVVIYDLHKRYGPIIRIGPNKLVTADVQSFYDLYTTKNVQKSQGYLAMSPKPGVTNTLNCVGKTAHRHKRKIVAQAFTDKHLTAFEPTMISHINVFIDNISKTIEKDQSNCRWSSPIKVSDYGRNLALDIMGSLAFGKSFDLQNSSENQFLIDAVNAGTFMSGVYVQYPKLQRYIIGDFIRLAGQWTRERFGKLAKDLAESRLKKPKAAKSDLFAFLIDAKNPETGEPLTLDDLWSESRLFLVAGSDTEICAISATLFYLSRYPVYFKKLASIIRSTFQSASDIHSGDALSSCHYLRACIDESMRMSPPISAVLWREVCEAGTSIGDFYIPPRTDIGSSLYVIHHNEDVFPESFKFDPERWIPSPSNPPEKIADQRKAFHPFSIGPRQCIAPPFAYLEISLTLAKTIWHFDIRRTSGTLDMVGAGTTNGSVGRRREQEFQLAEHITSKIDGPYLEFSRKQGLVPA